MKKLHWVYTYKNICRLDQLNVKWKGTFHGANRDDLKLLRDDSAKKDSIILTAISKGTNIKENSKWVCSDFPTPKHSIVHL